MLALRGSTLRLKLYSNVMMALEITDFDLHSTRAKQNLMLRNEPQRCQPTAAKHKPCG